MSENTPITLSTYSLGHLKQLILGDHHKGPYRSGPDLVSFFNQFGFQDEYTRKFSSSRGNYVDEKLQALNGTAKMRGVIENAVDYRHFLGTEFDLPKVVTEFNAFLKADGYQLKPKGDLYQLFLFQPDTLIEFGGSDWQALLFKEECPNAQFIQEQLDKCADKLQRGDFDGAITNSRSLVEGILKQIYVQLKGEAPAPTLNLPNLYKQVQKYLNLDPDSKEISESLKKILHGLTNIIAGLAPLRNDASDAHARKYKPLEHHARLAVNAAQTFCLFLIQSYAYQMENNRIHPFAKQSPSDPDIVSLS